MIQSQIKVATLYDRLASIGFPEKFVREQALPDWWSEEFESTPGALVEASAYISRRLNLDIASLLEPLATPLFKRSCQVKFKTKQGTIPQQLLVAHYMASRIAEMVAHACVPELKLLPESAKFVREEILAHRQFVNLEGVLEICWDYGIPVVYFDSFPKSQQVQKFDGMVAFFEKRPVIVISLNQVSSARLLFILAHELGHIIKGHANNVALVDENIEPESLDIEEIEANEFAIELLLGKPDIGYYTSRYFTGEQLASYAQEISIRDNIEPGAIVLNYSWNKARRAITKKEERIIWATATQAIKIIEGDADAPIQINRYAQQHLDFDKLDEDSQDYLELVIAE